MSSPEFRDEPGNFTPGSRGDLTVFPSDELDANPDQTQAESVRVAPLVPLAAAFAAGIALGPSLSLGAGWWAAAALLGLALGGLAAWYRAPDLRWIALTVGFLCLGAQSIVVAERGAPPHHLSRVPEAHILAPVVVEGWVAVPPDPRPPGTPDLEDAARTHFVADVTHLTLAGRRVAAVGRARLTMLGAAGDLHYGDEVRGTFRLRHPRRFENPGSFDYPAYLATQGVFLEGWTRGPVEVTPAGSGWSLLGSIFHVRSLLLRRLDAAMPPAEAGLLKATVLGDRSGLTPEMNQAFLDSGTYHILAISGLNVSLLAGSLFGLFRLLRVSARAAAAAAAILVTFYAALAGGSASVVRAAVMADVYLLAIVLDRRADLLNSLALSGLALLWWNPRFLRDVGFQLTFLATLGIVLILPRWESRLAWLPRGLRWVLGSVGITIAATAVTLPILASSFNRISPAGLLANIPIVPLSGLITGLGTAACAVLLVVPTGWAWLNQINGWLVDGLFQLASWFGGWPWSSVRVPTPTAGMLLCYYALLVMLLSAVAARPVSAHRGPSRRWVRWAAFGCAAFLGAQVIWRLYPAPDDERVRMTMLDVGQGEATHIAVPGRGHMLVDAGGMLGDGFDIGQRVIVPFLCHEWVNRLDVLVLTHPQSDHIGGAATILRTVPVGEVWTGDSAASSPTEVWIQEYLRYRRIPHRVVAAGDPPLRWGNAAVRVLHPALEAQRASLRPIAREPKPNDRSVVLRIEAGTQAILLTGDLEREGETALLQSGAAVEAQILKVGHHGSRQSSTEGFLRAVRPTEALVSVGHHNAFRHPHPETLARLHAADIRVWRTDQQGAISVELGSGKTRVSARRNE